MARCATSAATIESSPSTVPSGFTVHISAGQSTQVHPLNNPLISDYLGYVVVSVGRVAAEAEGIVRLGSAPAVPATDGGPGRAHLRDVRRRPRQSAPGVRRGQRGPPPVAQDPGVPVPKDAGASVVHTA